MGSDSEMGLEPGSRWRQDRWSRRDLRSRRTPPRGRSTRLLLEMPLSRDRDVDGGHLVALLDLVEDFHPGGDLAEVVVHAAGGEKWRVADGDEELRATHAGCAGSHARGASRPFRWV